MHVEVTCLHKLTLGQMKRMNSVTSGKFATRECCRVCLLTTGTFTLRTHHIHSCSNDYDNQKPSQGSSLSHSTASFTIQAAQNLYKRNALRTATAISVQERYPQCAQPGHLSRCPPPRLRGPCAAMAPPNGHSSPNEKPTALLSMLSNSAATTASANPRPHSPPVHPNKLHNLPITGKSMPS